MHTVTDTERREDHRHFHSGNNVACFNPKCASPLARFIGLSAEEIRELKSAGEVYMEYETDRDRIVVLESRIQRLKRGLNEVIAYVNSLEKRVEKLEK